MFKEDKAGGLLYWDGVVDGRVAAKFYEKGWCKAARGVSDHLILKLLYLLSGPPLLGHSVLDLSTRRSPSNLGASPNGHLGFGSRCRLC